MSEYSPLVSWETKISSPLPVLGEDFYYTCFVNSVNPNDYNPNELGETGSPSVPKTDQFYIVDYLGKIYEIVEILDAGTGEIKIYDLYEDTINGPYVEENAYVYQARENRDILTQAQRKRLHRTAFDMIWNIENNILQLRTFLKLSDTPSAYTSQAYKLLQVDSGESRLEFVTGIKVDSINEWTTDNGIDAELVHLEDGRAFNSSDAAPTTDIELANKKYVDDEIAGTFTWDYDWNDLINTPTTFSGYGISDNLANLNTAISDATLIDTADSRLSDNRTPTVHAMDSETYHSSSDITTLNATTSKHGFLPKLGGGTTNFLRADGTWATPSGGSSPLTTKGDLFTFSTINTRLPIGTNDYILTADSSEATGMKWSAASGGVSFGTDNQIPYMNSGGTDFDYDSNFTWNGTRLYMEDGNDNIYIGSYTGYINTDRIHNVAIGTLAGAYVKGDYNTFIGAYAAAYSGAQLYDHSGLTVIGSYAANEITTGEYSTFLGVNCGREFQTGTNCTYIGHSAGYKNDSGDYNTYLGHGSGYTGAGSSNLFLGNNSGYYETGSNKLFIDNQSRTNEAGARTSSLMYGEFDGTVSDQFLRINGQFQLIDGITAPSTVSGYAQIYVDSSDGDLKVKFGDGTVKTIATDS